MATVLVVDDEESIVWAFRRLFTDLGHTCLSAATAESGLQQARDRHPDLVFLDVKLPGMDGLTALETLKEVSPASRVVMITAHGTLDTAVRSIRRGAADYLAKPLDLDDVRRLVATLLTGGGCEEVERLRGGDASGSPIAGRSPAMQEVFKRIASVAGSDASVLVLGESGTGKELVARAIHQHSARSSGPFEAINCGALPEPLLESELFGHELGSFTGAVRQKPGKFEVATGGTIFLDEIGELPLPSQAKILRFLEDRRASRVGGEVAIVCDVRIVAATNRSPVELIQEGRFREDLFFRLNVVTVDLPPLRDRAGDLPLLVARFLDAGRVEGITDEAMAVLRAHPWPGNVRELRNALERGAVMAGRKLIRPEHLPEHVRTPARAREAADLDEEVRALVDRLSAIAPSGRVYEDVEARWERVLLQRALDRTGGNQLKAAEVLGINRMTLRRKMDRYGMER